MHVGARTGVEQLDEVLEDRHAGVDLRDQLRLAGEHVDATVGADVEIVISTEGIVSLARNLNSTTDDVLDEAALAAVRQWVFEPGSLHGELVPVRAIVTINFRVY